LEIRIANAKDHYERRKAIRYGLRMPVVFRWKGSGRVRLQGEGFTRDISAGGVFIVTSACLPPNAVVDMEILFPAANMPSNIHIKREMKVLRVENGTDGTRHSGFSAASRGFAGGPKGH